MKAAERHEARRLRTEQGMSVSLWTRDIELSDEQKARLAERNHRFDGQTRGHYERSQNARVKRLISQLQGRAIARRRDPRHEAGCMLYWADGSKSKNSVQFVNSDAEMLRFFKEFLMACYAVSADQLCVSVNCYLNNGLTLDEIERHWLDVLELPATSLRKATVNNPPRASKQQKRNLPYGTARLTLHSTHVLQSIYGAIQEYGGFDEPAWLG